MDILETISNNSYFDNFILEELLVQDNVDFKLINPICYSPVFSLRFTVVSRKELQIYKAITNLSNLLEKSNYTFRFYDIQADSMIVILYSLKDISEIRVIKTVIEEFKSKHSVKLEYYIDEYNNLLIKRKSNYVMQMLHQFIAISKQLDYQLYWFDDKSICIGFK